MAKKDVLKKLRHSVKDWNKWRHINQDEHVDLSGETLADLDLRGANLSEVNFIGAIFHSVDLRHANLIGAHLSESKFFDSSLEGAFLGTADLSESQLTAANLRGASLIASNLRNADLRSTNLERTNLSWSQALGTNFTQARFTGACLKEWHTNPETRLRYAHANFVYLDNYWENTTQKLNFFKRSPSVSDFEPDEFSTLFERALGALDIIFSQGINWPAFSRAFRKAKRQFGDELAIQAFEKKSGGCFVIRLEIPQNCGRAMVESSIHYEYNYQLKIIENLSSHTSPRINSYDSENDLSKIIDLMTLNFSLASKTAIHAEHEPQTATEAHSIIKGLLEQLEIEYPHLSEEEQAEQIRKKLPQSRLQRIMELIQIAGETAVESLPFGKVVTSVLKTVREQENR